MRATAAVFALLTCVACHDSPTEPRVPAGPPATLATLMGRTIDPSGTPVANVTVSLTSFASQSVRTTTSAADGTFTLSGIDRGGHAVSLRVNGGPEENGGSIRLLAGVNRHDLLVSSCKFPYGTVRDANTGRPIADAKVTIFYGEDITDANGHYQIDFGCDFVQGGTIVLSAEHPDYLRAQTLNRASFLCTCAYDFLLEPR